MAQQPLVGQSLLIIEDSRSHSDTSHILEDSSALVISPPAWLEPTIPASEWSQTHTLDRAATGIDW
jgi:hypothetical protein